MKSSSQTPPLLAKKFLRWFLREDLAEEVEGDLEEKYYATVEQHSPSKARINYWYQVFNYLRPFAIKNLTLNRYRMHYGMYSNYWKIGWRTLQKHKFFSLINISGMAISIASFLIIALYIADELRYDHHVEGRKLKYRVYSENFSDDGQTNTFAIVSPKIGPALANAFPEIESYTRLLYLNSNELFQVGEAKFTEERGGYADPGIFNMFSLELIEGDTSSALKSPYTIAISETLARKYFGSQAALGEIIRISEQDYTVSAVFQDVPVHSHLQLNYCLAMEGLVQDIPERMQDWSWSQFLTYLKVAPTTEGARLESKLEDFVKRYAWPETKSENGSYYRLHLMPLDKVHLYAAGQQWDVAERGNIVTIYILATAALFILVIAILNFVNLSTARAITRTKEVGIRKVMGAVRLQLIQQFISEGVLLSLIALIIGVGLVTLVLPNLNSFTGKSIAITVLLNPAVVLGLLSLALCVGLAAGTYPAFYISAFQPVEIMTHKTPGRAGRSWLREGLVVFQFVLSFFLIIASLIVSQQYTFMRTTSMGFEKDNLVVIQMRGEMLNRREVAKQAFMNHSGILSATMGYGLPGEAYAGDGIWDKRAQREWPISMLTVDPNYGNTLGLELIAGRDFTESSADEREAFIVSEAAAKMLGYAEPADALQHELAWPRWDAPDSLKEGRVIGVIKDLNLNSLRENITPVLLHIYPYAYTTLTLRISPENVPATIEHLATTWQEFDSEWPFEYKFLDDNFDRLYKAEEKLAILFRIFTLFTILVATLGLFGLVVYTTHQKFREISIRKVLGASDLQLLVQLARVYLLLIGVSFLLAAPFSYYVVGQWLNKFTYRIAITPAVFITASLFIFSLALITVGVQSYKASRANPVDALNN